uniref:RRM domain-containing protein n=1 Tax=Gouania willdenowi TaxID=441366 RepID=A0A8C5DDN2_GOUWI
MYQDEVFQDSDSEPPEESEEDVEELEDITEKSSSDLLEPAPENNRSFSWAYVTSKYLPPCGAVPVSRIPPHKVKVLPTTQPRVEVKCESQSSTQRPQRPKGRRIVCYPDAHQLFVGNIPHDLKKTELVEFFEQFGSVLDFKVISRGKHPNFGFVVFNNSEPVQKILSSRPIELFDNGRRMVRYPDSHQLFVGNIPHNVEKPELMDFFEQFGSVLDFKIISREKHPNFSFVVFNDSEPVQKILSSRPIELFDNVRLNVQEKKTRLPREVERRDARPRPGAPRGGGVRGPSSQGGGTNKPSLGSGTHVSVKHSSVCCSAEGLSINAGSTYPTMGNSVYLILLQLV